MPTPTKKPYRHFRAHGRADAPPDLGLEKLRELNRGEPARSGRAERRRAQPRTPVRRPVPPARRRWWSLRGIGPGGWIARVAGLLVLTVLVWAGLGYLTLRSAAAEANSRISQTARNALADPGGGLLGTPENTLIIGSDGDRGRTGARADTILVMRTDPDAGRLKYLSIPRDLRVSYPGQGEIKITEAFSHGGNAGLIRAIRRTIGLDIHHVVVVDFKGLSRMVDAVGGVSVSNPFDLRDCDYPGGRKVSFPRGTIDLDGANALVYSRVRTCDGDLQRAQRQQLVVAALKSKILSWGSLPSAPWRGGRVIRALSTDMSATELAKFGWLQGRLAHEPGDRQVLAGRPEIIGGIFYFIFDPDTAEAQLAKFQGST